VPRLIEALAGGKVVSSAASDYHTVVWTEVGELLWVWRTIWEAGPWRGRERACAEAGAALAVVGVAVVVDRDGSRADLESFSEQLSAGAALAGGAHGCDRIRARAPRARECKCAAPYY